MQSVRNSSSLPLFPPYTFPLLQCGSFHGLQYFRRNLLLHGLSMETAAPATRTCSCVGYQQATVPLGNVHLLHGLHCGYLLWHNPPWVARKSLLHCGPFSRLQGNTCSISWSTSSLSFSDLWCFQCYSSHLFPLTPPCLCSILPFLKYAFKDLSPASLMGSAVPCGGSTAEIVPAASGTGQPLVSSHRGHPCYQHLTTNIRYRRAVHGQLTKLTFFPTCCPAEVSRDL